MKIRFQGNVNLENAEALSLSFPYYNIFQMKEDNGPSPQSSRKKRGKRKGGTSKEEGIRVSRVGHGNRYVFISGILNHLSNLR